MNDDERSFVDALVSILPALQNVYTEALADFDPDEAPIIVLLGAFGRNIAQLEGQEPGISDQRLFEHIEVGVRSSHRNLRDAVITGLIEALYNRANAEGSWPKIRQRFGVESLRLAESW